MVNTALLIETYSAPLTANIDLSSIDLMMPSLNKNDCKIKRDKQADKNKKKPGESSLAKDIREITQTILAETDCDSLQMKVKTAMNGLKDDLDDKLKLAKEKLQEILPIISIPLNPFKIPSWLKKFAIGRVLPDLDATVDLIVRTAEVSKAITELITTIDQVVPRLKACAIELKEETEQEIIDKINATVKDLQTEIAETIAEAICQGVNAANITATDIENVLTGVNAVDDLLDSLKELQRITEEALDTTIASIGENQTLIQELTGLPPVLDTTSVESFITSTESEEYQQYKQDLGNILNIPDPVNISLPVITGNTIVGSTLSCSTGTWQANGNALTYSPQWFRSGAEIPGANTFTYIPTVDDVESKLYCMVTAQTNVSAEQAKSAETDFITFELSAENKPTITGSVLNGTTLSCSTGTWPFTPTMILYEWIRGESTVVQTLSSNNLYKVVSADVGSTIKCKVVAQSFKYTLSDITETVS